MIKSSISINFSDLKRAENVYIESHYGARFLTKNYSFLLDGDCNTYGQFPC